MSLPLIAVSLASAEPFYCKGHRGSCWPALASGLGDLTGAFGMDGLKLGFSGFFSKYCLKVFT